MGPKNSQALVCISKHPRLFPKLNVKLSPKLFFRVSTKLLMDYRYQAPQAPLPISPSKLYFLVCSEAMLAMRGVLISFFGYSAETTELMVRSISVCSVFWGIVWREHFGSGSKTTQKSPLNGSKGQRDLWVKETIQKAGHLGQSSLGEAPYFPASCNNFQFEDFVDEPSSNWSGRAIR